MRAKGLQVSPAVSDSYSTRQRAWDSELDDYKSAVDQGIRPAGTKRHQIDAAVKQSDATGVAFQA